MDIEKEKELFIETMGSGNVIARRALSLINYLQDRLNSAEAQIEESNDHYSACISELARICGDDISDEPRFKWAAIAVSNIVQERDKLRAKLAEIHSAEPYGWFNEYNDFTRNEETVINWKHYGWLALYIYPPIPSQQLQSVAIPEWTLINKEFIDNKPLWINERLWIFFNGCVVCGCYLENELLQDTLLVDSHEIEAIGHYVMPADIPSAPFYKSRVMEMNDE